MSSGPSEEGRCPRQPHQTRRESATAAVAGQGDCVTLQCSPMKISDNLLVELFTKICKILLFALDNTLFFIQLQHMKLEHIVDFTL